jgi:hypothetical protein
MRYFDMALVLNLAEIKAETRKLCEVRTIHRARNEYKVNKTGEKIFK